MSRSNGGLIAVKFDKKLIGDVTGRYPPVAGGPVEKLVIPALRSDGTKIFKDSVIYTDSVSYGGSLPTNAFDTSTSTYWSSMGTLPQWLQIDLGEGNAVLATKFRYYSGATYRIGEYKFEGSTDGLTWNLLWTGINDDTTGWRDITFVNTILYRFYRWTILTGRTAGNIYIYELELYANIPIGNEQAFAIQGQQYNYTPGGTLVPGDYKVESVKRYFISSVLYSENYSGTMDASLQIFTNKLMLNHINFVEDFEIEPFSVTVTGTLAKTNRDKFSGAYSLETTNRAHSSDSSGYITFQALAGRTISFRYRVSSQASVDKLYIYLNDVVLVNGIAGEGQWSQATGISKNGENIIRVRYVKNAAASYYLDAGFIDDIVIPINYENYGEYVSLPIDISLFPSSLKITWSAETSDETFAIVSTAVSDSSEVSPDGSLFVEQVSGQIITNLPIGSFQGKYLWIKISLSTNNELISPIMHRLILEDALENDDTILLTMDPFKRFHNVVGDLTVNYDATKGNLMGVGGLVDSFSISFTPTDLMVKTNPYIFEHIEVSASATGIRRAVFYTSGQASDEHIEVSNISAQGVLIHIDDL